MKSTIFIRTYVKDFPWLHYCLRSIRKFCTGFDVVVVVPDDGKQSWLANIDAHVIAYEYVPGKGMMTAMNAALDADDICPEAEYIFFVDCDCIFTRPVTPEDYFHEGKIVLPVTSYVELAALPETKSRAELWQPAMKAALGYEPTLSTMCRIPVVHHRSIFAQTRAAIQQHTGKSARDYLLSFPDQFPWKFSEFEALGCTALGWSSLYYTVDAEAYDPRRPGTGLYAAKFKNVNCYWSHAGITQQVRAEMEGILS